MLHNFLLTRTLSFMRKMKPCSKWHPYLYHGHVLLRRSWLYFTGHLYDSFHQPSYILIDFVIGAVQVGCRRRADFLRLDLEAETDCWASCAQQMGLSNLPACRDHQKLPPQARWAHLLMGLKEVSFRLPDSLISEWLWRVYQKFSEELPVQLPQQRKVEKGVWNTCRIEMVRYWWTNSIARQQGVMSLVPGSCFLHYHCMPCPSNHLGERRIKKLPIALLVTQWPYRSGLGSQHHSPTDAITMGSHNWSLLQRRFTGSSRDSSQLKAQSTWMRLCLRKECRIWCRVSHFLHFTDWLLTTVTEIQSVTLIGKYLRRRNIAIAAISREGPWF